MILLDERKGDRKTSAKLSKDILRENFGWECKNSLLDYIKAIKKDALHFSNL